MKTKTIKVKFKVPFYFEKGLCNNCPLSYLQDYGSDYGDGDDFTLVRYSRRCILKPYERCPLKSSECPLEFEEGIIEDEED